MRKTHSIYKNFYCLSISYEKAAQKTRGKYTIFLENLPNLKQHLQSFQIQDFLVVSTCNRTEIYAFTSHETVLLEAFATYAKQTTNNLIEISNQYSQLDAVEHFFTVGSGLKSQILGDFEIIGQIKTWFNHCKSLNTINTFLDRLMNHALQISKKIKNETQLSTGVTSVSYAAVNYILTQIEQASEKHISLYGLGKIGRNTLENLLKHTQNKKVSIINRTLANAENIAKKLAVQIHGLTDLQTIMATTDILILATASAKPTILSTHINPHKPLLIIDLTVPSNVEEAVQELKNVTLVGVDELSQIISQTLEKRHAELPKAKQIIQEAMLEFEKWLEKRKYAPHIQAFKKRLKSIHELEQNQVEKENGFSTTIHETVLIDKIIQQLTNHLAHHIIENEASAEETLAVINQVFRV